MNPTIRTGAQSAAEVLDVGTLGRPVHRLGAFAGQLKKDMADVFRSGLNRRYRAAFEPVSVTLTQRADIEGAQRWTAFASEHGRFAFSAERALILTVLGYRYGLIRPHAAGEAGQVAEVERETATEERVALALGEEICGLIARRILAGAGSEELPAAPDMVTGPASAPAATNWVLCCTVSDPALGAACRLWCALDDAWMERLLRTLAPVRDKKKDARPGDTPFPARLQMTLTARLLSKDIPLGELFDLRVGDVIPAYIGQADVLIDESALFTAAVAENKGKLCLTSFDERD